MMKKLNALIILFAIFLMACGNGKNELKEDSAETPEVSFSEKEIAFKTLNEQLIQNINDPVLYLKRARLYKKYQDISSAIGDVNRAIKIDSTQPEYYLLKAELLKSTDDLKGAKSALDQCMHVDNGNVAARIELGWLALIVMDYNQALDYADAALKRDVYSAEAYYLKGMIFQDKGDTALAISSFVTAIEQESDFYEAYIQLGILNLPTDKKLAKEYLKNALDLKPKSLEALYAFAMCCQEKGDYNDAIETYHKILSITPYKEPYFNLGYIHQEYLKAYEVAIENYTKAINLEPSYFEAYYNRGVCNEFLGKDKLAEADFRAALKLNPTYDYAALALDRLLKK
jgi:tetratricopeptide (TPR) repeat protein